MDPSFYGLRHDEEPADGEGHAGVGEKVTVNREPGSDTPLSGTKKKLSEDATNTKQELPCHEPSTPLNHANGLSSGAAPPGFST